MRAPRRRGAWARGDSVVSSSVAQEDFVGIATCLATEHESRIFPASTAASPPCLQLRRGPAEFTPVRFREIDSTQYGTNPVVAFLEALPARQANKRPRGVARQYPAS